jgi:Glycosyl transferase family 2
LGSLNRIQISARKFTPALRSLRLRIIQGYHVLRQQGFFAFFHQTINWLKRRLIARPGLPPVVSPAPVAKPLIPDPYLTWIAEHEPAQADLIRQAEAAKLLDHPPLISIILPVYNPPLEILTATLDSVRNQTYPFWELCIAEASTSVEGIRELLDSCAAGDARVRRVVLETNQGISGQW